VALRHRRLPARTVYLLIETVYGFLFTMMATVFAVYAIVDAELSPFRLLLLGTALELTILLFEVPTGVLADAVSRRLSIIVGLAITGAGFALSGSIPTFGALLVGQMLWGLGWTFVSGAEQAWITDEVGEEEAARLYLLATQRWQAGALVGIPAAVALGAIGLGLPLVASGIGFVGLAVSLVVVMPETRARRTIAGERRTLAGTFGDGVRAVRASHVLVLVFAVAALHGMSTEGFDRLSELHLLQDTTFPEVGRLGLVAWFGAIEAVGLLLGMIAAEVLKRRADVGNHAHVTRLLMGIDSALVVSVVAFAWFGAFAAALLAYWTVAFLREIRQPIFTAWLNRGLDSETRATVNSMAGQMDAVGQVAGGPTIGLAAIWWGVPAAIAIAGLIRAPAVALTRRAMRREEAAGEPSEPGTAVGEPGELA
jgi:DHA3 family tetracycline resistance protein-like MFS transporter